MIDCVFCKKEIRINKMTRHLRTHNTPFGNSVREEGIPQYDKKYKRVATKMVEARMMDCAVCKKEIRSNNMTRHLRTHNTPYGKAVRQEGVPQHVKKGPSTRKDYSVFSKYVARKLFPVLPSSSNQIYQ